jgi:hypothetical protein
MSKRADPRRRGKRSTKSPRSAVPVANDAGDLNDRLARLLETPRLPDLVPHLAPDVLHQLIQHRGLEACGPLVAAATPQQLASVFDLDLWQPPAAGSNEEFDEGRFGSWLETLIEEGEAVAARVIAAMDPDLATVGLARYLRVFDAASLRSGGSSDDDFEDVDGTASSVECEVGGYVIRAKTTRAWDAIVALLITLADERPESFHALMQGCRRLSDSTPEVDGLDELLLVPEQLMHDVSIDREQRRTQQGFLTAADARAFLQMARQRRSSPMNPSSTSNAIATAYFRALDDVQASAAIPAQSDEPSAPWSADADVSASIDALVVLLNDAGIAPARLKELPGTISADVAQVTPLQRLMEHVHDTDQMTYFARSRELAFLANALVAGCSVFARALTVKEAWEAVVGACNLGLEASTATNDDAGDAFDLGTLPDTLLVDQDLVSVFEAGWRLLHEDVSMFVANRLIATLAELRNIDAATQRDLDLLRSDLERQRDAGTPWRAGESLDVIASLDMLGWASLCGLLSECPVLPAALKAIVERHKGPVSATAFEYFTTREQIRQVREFMARLPEILL